MGKKRTAAMTLGIVLLVLGIMFLLVRGHVHRSGGIVLPETQGEEAEHSASDLMGETVVEITPDTVRPAITTLSRPMSYSRTQTVETFWSGGVGKEVYTVHRSGRSIRIDLPLPGGGSRHTLLTGEKGAVWFDEETRWTEFAASSLTGDAVQRMPTYETVRDLDANAILRADYRSLESGEPCVYVATRADENGYADRYWISTETGLLVNAEHTLNGELVYRFSAGPLSSDLPDESLFRLPDGSHLDMGA